MRARPLAPCGCWWPASPLPAPLLWRWGWSRRPGARCARVASLRREAAPGLRTPARAPRHRPMAQRLCRWSWRGGQAGLGRLVLWASPAMASPGSAPIRGDARRHDRPVDPAGRAWAARGAGRALPRTPWRTAGQAAAAWQACVPWGSSGHGLIGGMGQEHGEANSFRDSKRGEAIAKLATS